MIGAIVITISKNNENYKNNLENVFREKSLFYKKINNNMNKNELNPHFQFLLAKIIDVVQVDK